MRLLVTGAASGLGKYLCRRFAAVPLTRDTPIADFAAGPPFDGIIHCGAAAHRGVTDRSLYRYLADNILLTRDLCRLSHHRFIYISSIAVYPSDADDTRTETTIACDQLEDLYRLMKLGGEAISSELATRPLVLRISGMLGPDARPNSITRILTEDRPTLTLAPNSTFNYLLHEHIGDFVERALALGLQGKFNIAAGANAELGDIAERVCRQVRWGTFVYRTPLIDIESAAAMLPSLRRTTLENVLQYHALLTEAA